MGSERSRSIEYSLHLPPRETWLFRPGIDEPFEPPIDHRGLVDTTKLIALVQSTVDPDYGWDSRERPDDAHHLYWEHSRYPRLTDASVNPEEFCNLTINQIVIPRKFHNWLHVVTSEPPVPNEEAMNYQIEAFYVVRNLLRRARLSKRLTEERFISEERLKRGSEYNLYQFLIEVEEAQKLPVEFHPLNFQELQPATNEDMHEMMSFLGRSIAKANHSRNIRNGLSYSALSAVGATLST